MICVPIEYILISLCCIFLLIDIILIYKIYLRHIRDNQLYSDELTPINV